MSASSTISALRKKLTLAQLVKDSQADQQIIRRASREALAAWFRQSERLNIARTDHRLRGAKFIDFARRIGVDKSSAYLLVHLHEWRSQIETRCLDEAERAAKRGEPFYYPGWQTALSWYHKNRGPAWNALLNKGRGDDKRTPPDIFRRFGSECTLDVAASAENHLCRDYFTKRQDGLKQKWHGIVWMNPPYNKPTPWCKKALEYAEGGGTVVSLLPAWTDAPFFQDYCSYGKITFIRNRLSFGNAYGHAPFPSMIVEWSPATVQRYRDTGVVDIRMDDRSARLRHTETEGGAKKRYWLVPHDLYQALNSEFAFDFDPCPYPLPKDFNGLDIEWGSSNFINPAFNRKDAQHRGTLPAFVRKAIEQCKQGKTSVLVLPTWSYVNVLMDAGAEYRPLGRVKWLEVDSKEPANHPPDAAAFILRPGSK